VCHNNNHKIIIDHALGHQELLKIEPYTATQSQLLLIETESSLETREIVYLNTRLDENLEKNTKLNKYIIMNKLKIGDFT
jgi:hypothetical protein